MATTEDTSSQKKAVAPEDEPYWLGRASEEQKRLLRQHAIWTKSIGYLLHPSIASTLPPNARIADIGTGTGIWLKELAAISPPTHHFTGFDISSAQFLPAATLPANITLDFIDFKQPIPAHLRGTFDLVNVRLIIISMGPLAVWQATLRNLLTLLKPQGCITWTEGDFPGARAFRGTQRTSPPGVALTTAQRQFGASLSARFGFSCPDLARMFRDAGLRHVVEDALSTDRLVEQRAEVTQIGMGAVFGVLRNLSAVGSGEEGWWDGDEVERWRVEAEREAAEGAYLRWDIHVAVGWV